MAALAPMSGLVTPMSRSSTSRRNNVAMPRLGSRVALLVRMAWSNVPWLLRIASPLLLLGACDASNDPSSNDDGSEETGIEDLQCEGSDPPPPCVGLDTEGCLSEPAGSATCTNGEWVCSQPFTAPKLDPEAPCATPPAGDCEADPPSCSDQSLDPDSCSDYVIYAPAFCVDAEWACPPGYHDEGEAHCNWEDEGGG